MEKFIEKFADLFEDTSIDLITPETKFKNLEEWDSLMALSVISMVDEEYDVIIKGEDIRESSTIQDLFDRIAGKQK